MTVSVVVAAGEAGRALLPTVRSIRADPTGADAEIVVVVDGADAPRIRELLMHSGLAGVRIVIADGGRARQRQAGMESSSGEIVAIVDGGDLLDGHWLAAARRRLVLEPGVVVHPDAVVVFGRRDGWWPQPGHDDGMTLLPIAAAWASVVVAHRDTWRRAPLAPVDDSVVDAAWQARVSGSARHVRVPRTVAFVRVWGARAPWEPFDPVLTPRSPTLTDGRLAASRAARFAALPRTRVPERVTRVLGPVVRPWRRVSRRALHRLAAVAPDWAMLSWRAANRLEPLVLFPRSEIAGRVERFADERADIERAALSYWWTLDRAGSSVDILYFAPWVRTGGGDLVLRDYIAAVGRLIPGAHRALLTTEPDESTRLGELPADVGVAELREVLARGVSRDDLVASVVPALLVQLAPSTVHAFNSTVAFDVIEAAGDELARGSDLFLSTFAIDRRPDGERTSVLFLRRPGFLGPVRAVLVDSTAMIRTAVRELGYPQDRFRVQRSSVALAPLSLRSAPHAPLRVLWAGRFDLPKRLDVVVAILREASTRGVAIEVHVYGEEVMGHPGLEQVLRDLDDLGAVRHPPYARFADLDPSTVDAYLLTSEWEGVPLSVLEAMSAGIPVVAAAVGGVGEVVTSETGWPVTRFDDAAAYVDVFSTMIEDYSVALHRAEAARMLIEREFSPDAFDERLRDIEGYLPDVSV